ncbi:MAG: ACP S-malonyltransferase, partial [Treponema sp.]|nr:ACP S-malonyltransferase [Treponema sp.]
PVRWTDEEKVLADMISADKDNEWVILEVGPGKVLSGLWGQTELGATLACTPINTAEAIQAL